MADTVERPSPKAKRMLLAKRFGNRFSTGNALREQHANMLTWIKCEPPDAVVFAASTPEIIEVVKLCAEAARGGDPLRHEHLARRADQCAVRRHPAKVVTTYVCVPISALAACVSETHADIERTGMLAPIVGADRRSCR